MDIYEYLGETKPGDLCKIRDHPNRRLTRTEDTRHLTYGGTVTFFYLCPDCGAEWETVFHNTTQVSTSGELF